MNDQYPKLKNVIIFLDHKDDNSWYGQLHHIAIFLLVLYFKLWKSTAKKKKTGNMFSYVITWFVGSGCCLFSFISWLLIFFLPLYFQRPLSQHAYIGFYSLAWALCWQVWSHQDPNMSLHRAIGLASKRVILLVIVLCANYVFGWNLFIVGWLRDMSESIILK